MTTARKYNPGFLSDDELVASFCVRKGEFDSMLEVLRDCTGRANTHQLVIGPRGSGKTSLLLRVAAEIRRDSDLNGRFFPIVFAEESYEVSTAGEFWLECLTRLADQAPRTGDGTDLRATVQDLRAIRDDRTLGERCLGVLQDFADREGKRLVVVVENLNMMFADMMDTEAGWRLRQTLQTEPRIVLLASATARFDEIDNPDSAFYELFRDLTLRPLDTTDCAILWNAVSGRPREHDTIRALEILTGGSPRLLAIVARFGAQLSLRELMADLLDLVDDHTEYFKSHLDVLPAQERRVYLALAALWKPATTRETAERARLDTSKCSAQLGRLIDRGAVAVTGGSARRKLYYLTERLYNIYYLMRRGRGPDPVIEALVRFMEAYYSPSELREVGRSILDEATALDDGDRLLHRTAFGRLVELPSLAPHREELISLAPAIWRGAVAVLAGEESWSTRLTSFLRKAIEHLAEDKHLVAGRLQGVGEDWKASVQNFPSNGKPADLDGIALAFLNDIARAVAPDRRSDLFSSWADMAEALGGGDTPAADEAVARTGRAFTLLALERPDDALAASGEALKLVVEADTPVPFLIVTFPLIAEGIAFTSLNRCEEALAVWDRMERLSGELYPAHARVLTGAAGFLKVATFLRFDRFDEASIALDELLRQFPGPAVQVFLAPTAEVIARIWASSGRPGGTARAITVCDLFIARFASSEDPSMNRMMAGVFAQKGILLAGSNKQEEALLAFDEALHRFGNADTEELPDLMAAALFNKGVALSELNRHEEAVSAWDELLKRLGDQSMQHELVFSTLLNKVDRLVAINRAGEALTVCDDAIESLEAKNDPDFSYRAVIFKLDRAGILLRLNRFEEALEGWEPVLRPPEPTDTPEMIHAISKAFADKGIAFNCLNRPREALAAFEELLEHFDSGQWANVSLQVSWAHSHRSHALVRLGRLDEALAAANEALERSGPSGAPDSLRAAEVALWSKLQVEMNLGRWDAAIATVDRLLGLGYGLMPENRWRLHLARAKAFLSMGDRDTCALNVQAALLILSVLRPIPDDALRFLSQVAFEMEPALMRDLIQASPAAELLLPLTVALERELGLDPRVSREVEEVAEDIRRDFARPQKANPL